MYVPRSVQAEQADPRLVRNSKLSCCHLSGHALQPPIVADFLGNLYTKADVLEYLLARKFDRHSSVQTKTKCAPELLPEANVKLAMLMFYYDVLPAHTRVGFRAVRPTAAMGGVLCDRRDAGKRRRC